MRGTVTPLLDGLARWIDSLRPADERARRGSGVSAGTPDPRAAVRSSLVKVALPVLVAVSLLTAACGARPSTEGPNDTSSATAAPETTAAGELGAIVFLNQGDPGADMPSMADGGVLSVDERGCLRLLQPAVDPDPLPVWPPGYSLDAAGDGPARILDGEGRVVARVGDEIGVGGGPTSSLEEVADADERRLREIRERCPGAYFIVGEVVGAQSR